MPIVTSRFRPPLFLCNGHLQTILPVLLPRNFVVTYERERFELDDGDFLDLDWVRSGSDKLAIFLHGLEGSSEDGFARGTAALLRSAGWDVLAWNFRSCGREMNRLARLYHSGDTSDLDVLIRLVVPTYSRVALVGVSLGGNVTLKYLGERIPPPSVIAAVAISVPVDLRASAFALDHRWSNRIYLNRFIKSLVAKVEKKAISFPDQFDMREIRSIRTFRQLDDRYTAPIHGFRDAADYWRQSSSLQYLRWISVPTLLLNARDDPFLTGESFPYSDAGLNANLFLETPESGGHVGFIDFANGFERWCEQRIVEFLSAVAARKRDDTAQQLSIAGVGPDLRAGRSKEADL
jgi:predicted alpha/beta-fold hydrolase